MAWAGRSPGVRVWSADWTPGPSTALRAGSLRARRGAPIARPLPVRSPRPCTMQPMQPAFPEAPPQGGLGVRRQLAGGERGRGHGRDTGQACGRRHSTCTAARSRSKRRASGVGPALTQSRSWTAFWSRVKGAERDANSFCVSKCVASTHYVPSSQESQPVDEPRARGGRAQGAGSREGGARGRGWLASARSLRPLPRRNLCCRRSRDRPGRRRIFSGGGIRAEAGPPLPDEGCAPVGRRVGESRPASGTPGLALPPSSHRRRPLFDSARPPFPNAPPP